MVGESIGSYRITAKLGEGGMGAVYLGEHQFIARRAAIKVLLPELSANKDIVQRFFNEARATSVIHHPGIVEVLDCAVLPTGNAYIVMELLEGESLGGTLRRERRLSPARAVALTRQIAVALAAAHDKQIVHRDLKPDNVFVLTTPAGGSPIKILDFGIAKLLSPDAPQGHRTRTGSLMGTPVYMSPEQCRGRGEIDHRTDIYSLGCILFELLCGRPPFFDEGFGELIQSHLSVVPPSIRSLDGTLPAAVEVLVARMLAKAPADRPQTMRGLAADLDALSLEVPTATAGRSPAAGPISKTQILGPTEAPRAHTTLRSASGENAVVVRSESEIIAPGTRRRGPMLVAGALTIVVGVGVWRLKAGDPGEAKPNKEAPKVTAAPPVAVPAAPVVAAAPGPGPLPLSPPTPGKVPPAVDIASPRSSPRPTHANATRTINIAIASVPPGADVCLAKDRILLGRTRFDWKADKRPGSAKILIRKSGYRGEEVTVNFEHDAKQAVTLSKLGPDDIDDTDTCEKR